MTLLLALLAAALPIYLVRFKIGPFPTTALEILILFVIFAWVTQEIRNSKFEIRNLVIGNWTLVIPLSLFLIAAAISIFIAPNLRDAAGLWRAYFVEPIIIFLIAASTMKTPRDRQRVLYGLSIGALMVSAYAIAQKFTGIGIPPAWVDPATRRVTSVFGYPNAVGLYLGPLLPLFLMHACYWWKNKKLLATCYLLLAILNSITILFARSFGALAGVGTALVLMGLMAKKTRVWTFAAVIIVALVIALTPLKKPFADEFLLQGFSGKLRIAMWAETIEMLRDRPLFGAGLAGYQNAVAPYHIYPWAEVYLYPHNIILNFWSETGIVGLVAFGWICALLIRTAWYAYTRPSLCTHRDSVSADCQLALGLLGSFTVILIHGLVDVPYFKNDLSMMFWILAALTVAVSRDSIKSMRV